MDARFEQLKEEVATTRRIIDEFVDSQHKFLDDGQKQHMRVLQEDKENVKRLQGQLNELMTEKAIRAKQSQRQQSEMAAMDDEVRALSRQLAEATERRDGAKSVMDSLAAEIEKEKEALAEKEKAHARRARETTKGLAFYQERLGLHFEKLDDERLRFVFNNIDPDNAPRTFSFTIFIDANEMYHVEDCSPMIDGLAPLVLELNRTNQLAHFVKSIRRKFKEQL